ncbi:MAG TPA: hypothetical protein VIE67_00185 [Rudaea sp.]|jgi:threonine/homoserine/homoserine lactone efflux protein|uniref:hypothetical protein n=1 Tax=Rudaea sp. TaxID=2136325 RepID=UPI002F95D37C
MNVIPTKQDRRSAFRFTVVYIVGLVVITTFFPVLWGAPAKIPVSTFDWVMHLIIWLGAGVLMVFAISYSTAKRREKEQASKKARFDGGGPI